MKKILSICISAFLLSNMAHAATPGAYAGLGLGYSKQHTPDDQAYSSTKIGGLGGRIFGGYNFNNNFGLETGLAQYADSSYQYGVQSSIYPFASYTAKVKYQMRSLDLVGKAYLPMNDTGFNLYALGGVALTQMKNSAKIENNVYVASANETYTRARPKFGVGISYDVPQSPITTNLEFTRIQGKGNVNSDDRAIPHADMASVNIAYNFG